MSVVIVTYGNWTWVEHTLNALLDHTDADYEVVVVDNASPDDSVERLRATFDGVTIVENTQNLGFGTASNQGVTRARGRFVCLLNSDAVVQPGWLDPMVELLDRNPRVGAVVPMLLNLDGSLQESGGLIGREGSVLVVGHDGDPADWKYRFRRSVDYGSGACMLVRRSDFQTVGGFDARYGLGYFEDVDLCFALEATGKSVVYEPLARVVHAGGVSSDTESKQRLFERNHQRFSAKWAPQLVGRVPFIRSDYYDQRPLAARDHECLDRLLVVANDDVQGRSVTAALLAALPGWWPSIRVTVAIMGPDGVTGNSVGFDPGVELADAEDWLKWFDARRYHYSVVVACGGEVRRRVAPLVDATQPQAIRAVVVESGPAVADDDVWAECVFDLSGPEATIAARFAALGVTPPA